MDYELNGPHPLTGDDAVLPPMAGMWMVWITTSLVAPAIWLWWDGAQWFDSRGYTYPHVSAWAGLRKPNPDKWPDGYKYPLHMQILPLPDDMKRARVDFAITPERKRITYVPMPTKVDQ